MRKSSSIVSSTIGNIIEWYDFGLFSIFSALFGRLFFPTHDPHVALIATFGIFAVGFICRPVGALIFGYLGDKYGRVKTLKFSILMIAVPTFGIGFIPTYHQVGIIAPLLLTATRILQGISIGGEYSGNLIYLAESAPKHNRATITSLASSSSNIGILLAAVVGMITTSLMSEVVLEAWGWRLPYLISGWFCILIYIYRLNMEETKVFTSLKNKNLLNENPILIVFKTNFKELLRTLGLVCMGSSFYFFTFVFIPIFIKQQYQLATNQISTLMSILIFLMIFFIPIAGRICDIIGRKKMLVFNFFLISLTVIPGFYFLHLSSYNYIFFTMLIFTIASSLEQGTTAVAVIENFPPPARYTGVSLGYNIGNGFIGGTVALVCSWLLTISTIKLLPAFYIAGCALVTGITVLAFTPETKNKPLI